MPTPPSRYTVALEELLAWRRWSSDRAFQRAVAFNSRTNNAEGWLDTIFARAEPIFVADSMLPLVRDAAGRWPDTPLSLDWLPLDAGFIYVEAPPEAGMPGTPGDRLAWLSFPAPPQDPAPFVILCQCGPAFVAFDDDVKPDAVLRAAPFSLPFACLIWRQGERLADAIARRMQEWDVVGDADVESGLWGMGAGVVALATVMQQRLAVRTTRPPDRAARRRLERGGVVAPPTIEVVELRARDYQPAAGAVNPVDWSWRWIVRAHWRNQYHGPGRPHQRVIVPAHLKGPEGKPLKAATKLYAVVH